MIRIFKHEDGFGFQGAHFHPPPLNAAIFPPKKWPDYEAHHEIWRIFDGILGKKKLKINGLKNRKKKSPNWKGMSFSKPPFFGSSL